MRFIDFSFFSFAEAVRFAAAPLNPPSPSNCPGYGPDEAAWMQRARASKLGQVNDGYGQCG